MNTPESTNADGSHTIPLQKRVVLYFDVHHQFEYRSLKEEQDVLDLIDHDATKMTLSTRLSDVYAPVTEMLLKMAKSRMCTIALGISGQTLELFARHAPDLIITLKSLNETGMIEWLAVPYNDSIAALVSEDAYREEITRVNDILYEQFGVHPRVLLATPFFESSMVRLAGTMGFEALLLKDDVWPGAPLVYDDVNELFVLATADRMVTNAITMHFGPGESTLKMEELIAAINRAIGHTVVIGFSFDLFAEHRNAGILSFFESFLAHAAEQRKLVSVSALLQDNALHTELPKLPLDLVLKEGFDKNNEMLSDALAAVSALDAPTRNLVDGRIRESWRQLLSAEHFVRMSSARAAFSSHYLSSQDAFKNYMETLDVLRAYLATAAHINDDQGSKADEAARHHPTTPNWAVQEQARYQQVTHSHL